MLKGYIEKAISPYKDTIYKVLDFGCGESPVLSSLLREEGYEVDIYDKFFSAKKTYRRKTYDLITATEVIEHLPDPLSTFKLFRSLLNKDGIISIMTLFHPQEDTQFIDWWYRRDRTHISFYSPVTVKYLADIFNMKLLICDNKNIFVLQI